MQVTAESGGRALAPNPPAPAHARPAESARERLRAWLSRPTDAASLAAFRVLLGLLLFCATLRAWHSGVVEQAFLAPKYFFPHYGLAWLPPPGAYAYALYALIAGSALCLALGAYTRVAAAVLCLAFSYAHFVDVTNYLNHYYLVSLLTGLLAMVPTGNVARLTGRRASVAVPFWVLALFRFQVGLVYFFGGVAKLKYDWLFHAQPLRTWLAANTELPVLGPWFALPWVAYVFSWAGALYDLSVPFALSHRRTRPFAYLAVVFFHLLTARLFQIGIFPYLMMVNSLLFLAPDWPRRLYHFARAHIHGQHHVARARERALRRANAQTPTVPALGGYQAGVLALYAFVQVLTPLRHWLYPGDVLWTEQGYRFSWNVMLIEKTGFAEFTLVDRATGQKRTAFPRTILTRDQTKAMATQPDMILAFAHELAARERDAGRDVAVYADVFVTLNGRAPQRLIDPHVDLAREQESFRPKRWILPGPRGSRTRPRSRRRTEVPCASAPSNG